MVTGIENKMIDHYEKPEHVPNMMLLIDADIMYHRAAFSIEEKWDFGGHTLSNASDKKAIDLFGKLLQGVLNNLESTRYLLCWSLSNNYRKDLFDGYKANRKDARRPECSPAVKEELYKKYPHIKEDGIEADDIMGLYSGPGTIIVSDDKDMLTVPGCHYRPRWPEDGMVYTSRGESEYYWYMQILTGDRTDGYTGIPGIGPKKAAKILAAGGVSWRTILKAYEDAGLPESEALLTARLARILQPGEYDWETKTPKLWEPT